MSRAMTAQDHRLAVRSVLQLYTVLRTARFHDASNKALLVATENLKDTINTLWASREGSVRIQFVDGVVFLDDIRVAMDGTTKAQVDFLQSELDKRELGGLSFSRPVDGASLRDFLVALARPAETAADVEEFRQSLRAFEDLAVELLEPSHFEEVEEAAEVRVEKRTFALQTYAKSIIAVREFIGGLRAGREPHPRLRIHRIVQDLVDIAEERVDHLVILSAHRQAHDYAYGHAANTCVLSIALGRALNVDRLMLADLGLSAILADIGFALLPTEDLDRPRTLSESEREELLDTMLGRVASLVSQGQVTPAMVRRLVVAYEHHRPYRDPETGETAHTHLFSRIVQVADVYDALTSERPWRTPYSSEEAMRILMSDAGRRFDPLVVDALTGLLRMYLPRSEAPSAAPLPPQEPRT